MSETKITAEWCEARANAAAKFATALPDSGSTDSGALGFVWESEALRLAARALRAKAWLRLEAEAAGCAQETATTDADAWRSEGRETLAAEVLAILEGDTP